MPDRIANIRSFNRTITRRLGALEGSFLGGGLSLGLARLLFEIGSGVGEVRRLRAELGLDSGHMSRMLRSLETKGLIETSVDAGDARARVVRLTKKGRAKLDELEGKSNEGAESWLAPLSGDLQERLEAAMAEVERLLAASEISIGVEDPASEAAAWCVGQFFDELAARFPGGFDPGLTASASPDETRPPAGYFLLARLPDQPVGCAALKLSEGGRIGEVKRMWVAPRVRGLGLGRRLLEAVEEQARQAGVQVLRLSTNSSLTEAQSLYLASGYREIPPFDDDPYAQLAFEKRLDR
ncbi:MAG TPA: bifunctional helix-turn-helix transcriptional regulator/GNAT family N-acetyltransferase [Thermoanaerobaculia bacterium]|nr:bifunctional helix-turn-helix transcriptional regulator/GNAT family N-acetyltransferase [Thermoanaerobaculia bacterium]